MKAGEDTGQQKGAESATDSRTFSAIHIDIIRSSALR